MFIEVPFWTFNIYKAYGHRIHNVSAEQAESYKN